MQSLAQQCSGTLLCNGSAHGSQVRNTRMRSLSSLHSQLLQRCQHLGRPLRGGRATAVKTYAVLETEITTVATPGVDSRTAPKPAEADAAKFQLHPSVNAWRTYDPAATVDADAPLATQIQSLLQGVQRGFRSSGASSVFESPESAAYWAYHVGRMSFFTLQGIAGLLSARTSSAASGNAEGGTGRRLERLVRSGAAGPVAEALATYQQDYANIKAGLYKLPWDMTTLGHRQVNPLFVLRKAALFLQEAADTLGRRDRQAGTSVWLDSKLYPDYYRNTFHYQTDGWMSKKSADIYETSTETLFLGKQDAMQRQTLVPLHHHMRTKAAPNGAGMKLLEVACGTGRFATFIKDNYPEMELSLMDLSPFYLSAARDNMAYWRRVRAPPGQRDTADTYIQGAAEDIPADDNTFDVVTCVYLFHELPEDVRRKAAAEMARVCKPGGLVVLTDSVQYGDREAFDPTLGNFGNFNEPWYQNYISTEIGQMFEEAGLTPHMKTMASSTKALSFKKLLDSGSEEPADSPPQLPAAAADVPVQPTSVTASFSGSGSGSASNNLVGNM